MVSANFILSGLYLGMGVVGPSGGGVQTQTNPTQKQCQWGFAVVVFLLIFKTSLCKEPSWSQPLSLLGLRLLITSFMLSNPNHHFLKQTTLPHQAYLCWVSWTWFRWRDLLKSALLRCPSCLVNCPTSSSLAAPPPTFPGNPPAPLLPVSTPRSWKWTESSVVSPSGW